MTSTAGCTLVDTTSSIPMSIEGTGIDKLDMDGFYLCLCRVVRLDTGKLDTGRDITVLDMDGPCQC